MKVIGLDLSLTATGYCHPDGRTETLSSKQRGMARILDICDAVVDRLGDVGEVPLVAIEDYAFSRGGHAHETGELGGVIKYVLMQCAQPYVLIGPSALKKFATSKGNANKIAMAVAAAKLGQEFTDDNCCDAWWLAQMARYRFESSVVPATAYRDEAVSKVTWPTVVTEMGVR